MLKHEKPDCSDDGVENTDYTKQLEKYFKCEENADGTSTQGVCDDYFMKIVRYTDKECKTQKDEQTMVFGCDKNGGNLVKPEKKTEETEKTDEAASGAHLLQVAFGSLVLGAASYMA